MILIKLISIVLIEFVHKTEGACSWPAAFSDTMWTDGRKGNLTFTSGGTMIGWNIATFVTSWECFNTDFYDSDSILVFKSTNTFNLFGSVYGAYMCFYITTLTDYSFRYYIYSPINNEDLDKERLWALSSTDPKVSDILGGLCLANQPSYKPSVSEYGVLIKTGFHESAFITCPYHLLADYSFTYTTDDGTLSCSETDVGDVIMCTDVSQMTSSSLACSQYPLYSDSGSSRCIDVVTSGANTFVTLYNGVTGSGTYMTSCLAINSAGTSMSVTSNFCKNAQTPSEVPVDNFGKAVGAVMSLAIQGDPCPPCPSLNDPFHGNVTITTSGAVTMATYACDGIYTISGSNRRECQTDGTWSGSEPACACPVLSSPTGGNVELSVDGLTATYSCDVGWVLVGVTSLTCVTSSNTWSGTAPLCVECQPLASFTNGDYNITSDGLTSHAEYFCADGYYMNGGSSLTCLTSGAWDGSPPTCYCVAPEAPGHGAVSVSVDGSTAVYTCSTWYNLEGASVRQCQDGGMGWSDSNPQCVQCSGITAPESGGISLSTNGTVTSATFSCDVGFTISGEVTSTCIDAITWSSIVPDCIQCVTPPTLTSGQYTLTSDNTQTSASVECDIGSTLSGSVTLSCDVTGQWEITGDSPSCVSCVDPPTTTGGAYTLKSNGTTTYGELTCEIGYTLDGDVNSVLQCSSNGTWSSTFTSTSSQCVLESSSQASSGGDDLLTAVIALSILSALLAVGLVTLAVYAFVIKGIAGSCKVDNVRAPAKASAFPISRAPVDHSQHVMDSRILPTPLHSEYTMSPRNGFVTPREPSMRSALSTGSLEFDLVRETTASSIYQHPAPWTTKTNGQMFKISDNANSAKINGQAISSDNMYHKPGSDDTGSPRPNGKKKRKKQSMAKRLQLDNSFNSDQDISNSHRSLTSVPSPIPESANENKTVEEQRNICHIAESSKGKTRTGLSIPMHKHSKASVSSHVIAMETEDLHHTPRSGLIPSVQ